MGEIVTIPLSESFSIKLAQWLKHGPLNTEDVAEAELYLPSYSAISALRNACLEQNLHTLPRFYTLGNIELTMFNRLPQFSKLVKKLSKKTANKLDRHFIFYQVLRARDSQTGRVLPAVATDSIAKQYNALYNEQLLYSDKPDSQTLSELLQLDTMSDQWLHYAADYDECVEGWNDYLDQHNLEDETKQFVDIQREKAVLWKDSTVNYPIIMAGSTGSYPFIREQMKVLTHLSKGYVCLHAHEDEASESIGAFDPAYAIRRIYQAVKSDAAYKDHSQPNNIGFMDRYRKHFMSLQKDSRLSTFLAQDSVEEAKLIALFTQERLQLSTNHITIICNDSVLRHFIRLYLDERKIGYRDNHLPSLSGDKALRLIENMAGYEEQADTVSFYRLIKSALAYAAKNKNDYQNLSDLLDITLWRKHHHPKNLSELLAKNVLNHEDSAHAVLIDWLHQFSAFTKEEVTLGRSIDKMSELLNWLHDSTIKRDSADLDVIGLLHEIRQCSSLTENGSVYSFHDALQYVLAFIKGSEIQQSQSSVNVSLSNNIDARFNNAETVIITGLNHDNWPQLSENIMENNEIRDALHLPTSQERIGQASRDIISMLSAQDILLTRANNRHGLQQQPSIWWEVLADYAVPLEQCYQDWLMNSYSIEDHLNYCIPEPTISLQHKPKILSATALKHLLRNPYFFYSKYILSLGKLEELFIENTSLDYGNNMHRYLEYTVPNLIQAKFNVISTYNPTEIYGHFKDSLWEAHFKKRADISLKSVLNYSGDFDRVLTEYTMQAQFDAVGLTFLAKADAILWKIVDGNTVLDIIDYKTGNITTEKDILAGLDPQLPLYYWLSHQDKMLHKAVLLEDKATISSVGVCYFSVPKKGDSRAKWSSIAKKLDHEEFASYFHNLAQQYTDDMCKFRLILGEKTTYSSQCKEFMRYPQFHSIDDSQFNNDKARSYHTESKAN